MHYITPYSSERARNSNMTEQTTFQLSVIFNCLLLEIYIKSSISSGEQVAQLVEEGLLVALVSPVAFTQTIPGLALTVVVEMLLSFLQAAVQIQRPL